MAESLLAAAPPSLTAAQARRLGELRGSMRGYCCESCTPRDTLVPRTQADREELRELEAIRDRYFEWQKANQLELEHLAREELLEHLTPEQRQTYASLGYIEVVARNSGRCYRLLTTSYSGNIRLMSSERDGTYVRSMCCHIPYPAGREFIPVATHLLSQKLMIEANEQLFLATTF